nr:ATP-binding protein [Lachnospiraceae bacterium]
IYGQKGIGKTTLLLDFIKDKDSVYYLAGEASARQQQYLMAQQFRNNNIRCGEYPSYEQLMQAFSDSCRDKKVLVIDEFEYLLQGESDLMDSLLSLLTEESEKQYMILLCSSSVSFVENRMVSKIGRAALSISAFIKVKEIGFDKVKQAFPHYSANERIALYAILGGVPALWNCFDPEKTLVQNLCENLIDPDSFLSREATRYVRELVREGGVYYSILSALGSGKDKLGDIYEHTGFSRAKISVYLKNLMEHEIAEKVFSLDTRGRDMQRKGIYRISNHFCNFYFRFLYPNQSMNRRLSPQAFYDTYVSGQLEDFCKPCFSAICRDYMEELIMDDDFDFEVADFGVFDGKEGLIDFLAMDEDEERCVAAFCCYDKPFMPYEFYEAALHTLQSAKVPTDLIYLFSRDGFDEKVRLEAKVHPNVRLLSMQEWMD